MLATLIAMLLLNGGDCDRHLRSPFKINAFSQAVLLPIGHLHIVSGYVTILV
jgi:hypothetical protein